MSVSSGEVMSTIRFFATATVFGGVLMIGACVSDPKKPTESSLPIQPTVKVAQGKVQGTVTEGVVVFKGLPYAAPPVGELRWHAPQQAQKWQQTKVADTFASTCADAEDCLYLNVYAPAAAKKGYKLPVMVWIHGGAFVFGAGSAYDGSQFAKQGVILVTMNYRLGRAGWFAHPALTAENPKGLLGNYGLMDQIAALEWVRDNIKEFGGDQKNVTIFGESAGAISVNYLMLSPEATGLFTKAISESGFGRLAAAPISRVEQSGAAFGEQLGVHGSDAAAAEALRALSWADLKSNLPGIGAPGQILPMADGRLVAGSAADGFAKDMEAHIPYLLGGNSDEASLTRRGYNAAERFASIRGQRSAFIAAFDPTGSGDVDRIMARLVTDVSISEPNRDLARQHARHGSATYVYHFSYTPAAQRATLFGLSHGGELAYVFNTPRAGGFDEEGNAVAASANRYWAQFAKTGDPDSAGGANWPKFEAADENVMEFPDNGVPIVTQHFHKSRLDWVEAILPFRQN
jgi:para-nitrobenzyl esterase